MKQNLRKFLAALTGLSLALACLPGAALAEPADPTAGLCPHHTEHTAECGYRAAAEAHECGHVHDETCGYAEAKDEVPCDQNCAADAEEGQSVTHKEGCAYQIAQAASPCTHVHDEACGYAEADDGAPCAFECALCAVAVYANPNLTLFVSDSDGAPVT